MLCTRQLSAARANVCKAKLQNYGAFLNDVHHGTLPSVSFVRPFESLAGHPADSTTDLYERFLDDLIKQVQNNHKLWASTAIFIATDEGGGYYDSGFIQILDFFATARAFHSLRSRPMPRRAMSTTPTTTTSHC